MSRLSKEQNLIKENIIVDALLEHRGEENHISVHDIQKILRENEFCVQHRSINQMITKIKLERRIPICYKRGKGYFLAKRKSDIETTLKDLGMMIKSLQEHYDFLESFIKD